MRGRSACGQAGLSRLRLRRVNSQYPTPNSQEPRSVWELGRSWELTVVSDTANAQAHTRVRRHALCRLAATGRGGLGAGPARRGARTLRGCERHRARRGAHRRRCACARSGGQRRRAASITTSRRCSVRSTRSFPPISECCRWPRWMRDFHARFSARAKTYQYRIRNTPVAGSIRPRVRLASSRAARSGGHGAGSRDSGRHSRFRRRFRAQAARPAEPRAPLPGPDWRDTQRPSRV